MVARNRRRGRVPTRNASEAAPPILDLNLDVFDDAWLRRYSEHQYSRFVDLTKYEDRRRWHPSTLGPGGPAPQGYQTRPRIVVVPEGHSLARHAPYGGRIKLSKLLRQEERIRRRSLDDWTERTNRSPGRTYQAYGPDHLSRRVGFSHPWQVIVCVRRKRRKEVLHALRKTGRGGGRQKKPRRNFWSEVRC